MKAGHTKTGDPTSWKGIFASFPYKEPPKTSMPFDITAYDNYEIDEFELDARTEKEK